MRFEFGHTHACPGCPVRIPDDAVHARANGHADIEFSDGHLVSGTWSRVEASLIVDIPAHRTMRGTAIAARRWRLEPVGASRYTVAARIA